MSKATYKKYLAKLEKGLCIMRDSTGKMQWSDGRHVGCATVQKMLKDGVITELDADLFGNKNRGQTIGLSSTHEPE